MNTQKSLSGVPLRMAGTVFGVLMSTVVMVLAIALPAQYENARAEPAQASCTVAAHCQA